MDDPAASGKPPTHRLTFRALREVPGVMNQLVDACKAQGFDGRAVFGLTLSLEEVLTNAVRHGNQKNPEKQVTVEARIDDAVAVIAIEDEGAGFVPDELPDCTAGENLLRPHGRGVMLINAYMTEVRYNSRGNRVTLVKRRDCEKPVIDDDPTRA